MGCSSSFADLCLLLMVKGKLCVCGGGCPPSLVSVCLPQGSRPAPRLNQELLAQIWRGLAPGRQIQRGLGDVHHGAARGGCSGRRFGGGRMSLGTATG